MTQNLASLGEEPLWSGCLCLQEEQEPAEEKDQPPGLNVSGIEPSQVLTGWQHDKSTNLSS